MHLKYVHRKEDAVRTAHSYRGDMQKSIFAKIQNLGDYFYNCSRESEGKRKLVAPELNRFSYPRTLGENAEPRVPAPEKGKTPEKTPKQQTTTNKGIIDDWSNAGSSTSSNYIPTDASAEGICDY